MSDILILSGGRFVLIVLVVFAIGIILGFIAGWLGKEKRG